MTTADKDSLMKTPEMAERSGISKATAKRWRQEGFGPPWLRLKGPQGEVRYPLSKFQEWMEKRLNESLADEYSKRPPEASDELPEPEYEEPEVEYEQVFDSRLGKRVRRRKGS